MTDPASDPAAADSPHAWEPLHPNARWGMRATAMLLVLPPYVVAATPLFAALDRTGLAPGGRLPLFVAGLLAVLGLAWLLAGVRWSRTRFALDQAGLHIRRGIWWRNETFVPRSRVQHIDLNRGPLDRHFGIASLRVHTAGTRLASINLDGLPEARARELRDALVAQVDDGL